MERRQVSSLEVVRGGVDVLGVARRFRPAVYGIVLGSGDRLEEIRVVALQAVYEGDRDLRGQVRILTVRLLPASPARIAKDVDIG